MSSVVDMPAGSNICLSCGKKLDTGGAALCGSCRNEVKGNLIGRAESHLSDAMKLIEKAMALMVFAREEIE